MIDKQQAEVIGDVLLSEQLAARQVEETKRREAEKRRLAQHHMAIWALAGLALGALIGHFVFANWAPALFIGFGIGAVLGRWSHHRASR